MALNGIDIASYQASIVPANLKTTDFVIIKATQGVDYINPYFKNQYEKSKAAGKLVGLYHYVDGSGAEAQAEFFVKTIKQVDSIGKAILAVDQQEGMNKKWGDAVYVKKLMDKIYALTKVRPFLYVQQSAAAVYNNIQASGYPLWGTAYANYELTDYQSTPWSSNKGWGKWGSTPTIRQYSSSGRITGYKNNLDLDLFYGTKQDWKAFAAQESQESTKEAAPTTVLGKNITTISTKEIQKMLNEVGKYNLILDGVYGKLTTAAVVNFQKKYKLHVDGIVGNQTLSKLEELYRKVTIPVYKEGDYSKTVVCKGKVVNTNLLNVRKGPGMNYSNIKQYPIISNSFDIGICMKTKSGNQTWYYVKIKGNKGTAYGFVHGNYLAAV